METPHPMRIGEFVRVSGVSRETIHFYLREGLLPPAHKVNARVAYFDGSHLARLLVIKQMRQAHLPLSMIREHLDAVQGLSPERIAEGFIPLLTQFLSLDGDETELSSEAVAGYSGLTREQLEELEALGVLRPTMDKDRPLYTQADADAAVAARILLEQGVGLQALRFVQRYTELIKQEHAFILHHLIEPALAAGRRDQVSARRGFEALRLIEAYLLRQFRREYGLFGEVWGTLPDPLNDSTDMSAISDAEPDDPDKATRSGGKL